jgi:hypothetical protein
LLEVKSVEGYIWKDFPRVESLKETGCTDLLEGISVEEKVTHFSWSEMH